MALAVEHVPPQDRLDSAGGLRAERGRVGGLWGRRASARGVGSAVARGTPPRLGFAAPRRVARPGRRAAWPAATPAPNARPPRRLARRYSGPQRPAAATPWPPNARPPRRLARRYSGPQRPAAATRWDETMSRPKFEPKGSIARGRGGARCTPRRPRGARGGGAQRHAGRSVARPGR